MEVATLRYQSTPYSGHAPRANRAWQSARSCEAASTSPALTILAALIHTPRLLMGVATLRYQSTPYSGHAQRANRAWQSARSCEAASTNPALTILAALIILGKPPALPGRHPKFDISGIFKAEPPS
jgi:hypothetical protein